MDAIEHLIEFRIVDKCATFENEFDAQLNNILKLNPAIRSSEQAMKSIASKCIAVIGCGAIGCHVIDNLVSSGFKKLILVNGDIVEESNLARQHLYTYDDIGKYKVDVAKKRMNSRCSDLSISVIRDFISVDGDFPSALSSVDMLVISADNPPRLMSKLNKDAIRYGKPYITGGFFESSLLVGPLWIPFISPCFNCVVEQLDNVVSKEELYCQLENYSFPYTTASNPLLATLGGMIIAYEIQNYFLFETSHLKDSTLIFDSLTGEIFWEKYKRLDTCKECSNENS